MLYQFEVKGIPPKKDGANSMWGKKLDNDPSVYGDGHASRKIAKLLASGEITIAFWQYGDAAVQPQNDTLFRASDSDNDRVLNIHLPYGNENIVWDAGNSGSSYDRCVKTATAATEYEGQWNHWVFTKNVSAGQMKIYLNGSLWHNESNKFMPIEGITSVRIGSNHNGASNYDGIIDDFRIYDYELAVAEINDIYNE